MNGGDTVIPARQGRENQRYDEEGRRLVAGCIVVRETRGEKECLMISSTKDPSKFIFPKGGWEIDETLEQAAVRETLEEAGVVVKLVRNLGWFLYDSKKGEDKNNTANASPKVCFFQATCVEERAVWAEGNRQRHWVPVKEASGICKHK
ncbi:hypothetical protein GUITHDRAFT_100427 [Guillardia theta CCMP2712]|uniref:Nudix hydrolase domain-containing protein n=2 Tax=Guillardia theta TaxID=55529 RepID=L1K1C3_GUITC|nr:hypothetical protein GUITHDRAFT_100427 [Guillardia theta CCMP2712]EKX54178.1 hypothetical protein GUITHDRAFT_100427 [Guillardia theta CCMP2712]|eukprot:XP_005841158.1 hypothetical protein GUITHDRAFT_100427 [Guillardia theta CCMP2712]